MTIFTSNMIGGLVNQQNQMFTQNIGYGQALSYSMQPPPMMMPQMGMFGAAQRGQGGIYGEQMAMRMANAGQTAMGVGMSGLGLLSAFSPVPMDPFSGALMGARFGVGGAAMGAAGGAIAGLPLFAATQAAQVYGGAFTGGMRDQAQLNSTLRNNFSFFGGQGPMGRGFGQQHTSSISGLCRSTSTALGRVTQTIGAPNLAFRPRKMHVVRNTSPMAASFTISTRRADGSYSSQVGQTLPRSLWGTSLCSSHRKRPVCHVQGPGDLERSGGSSDVQKCTDNVAAGPGRGSAVLRVAVGSVSRRSHQ